MQNSSRYTLKRSSLHPVLEKARKEEIEKIKENKEFLKTWEDEGKKKHRKAMQIRTMREKKELQFELTMAEKKKRIQTINKEKSKQEMVSGICDFEKTLERMGKDSKNNPPSSNQENYGVIIDEENEEEAKKQMEKDAMIFVNKIKAKKIEETVARKDREQRRRKIMIEQQKVFREIEEKRRRELLLEKLMRQSLEERKLAKQLLETMKWKDVFRENRILREKQYQERREADLMDQQRKYAEITQREREERIQKLKLLMEKYEDTQQELLKKKTQKRFELCGEIVERLVEIAIREVQFKVISEGEEPSEKDRTQWKSLFIAGESIIDEEEIVINETNVEETIVEDNSTSTDVLDEGEMLDYLLWRNEWSTDSNSYSESNESENKREMNNFTAEALKTIQKVINPPKQPLLESKFKSRFKTNAIILGKPFSGKTSICSALSKHDYTIFNVQKILSQELEPTIQPQSSRTGKSKSVKSSEPEQSQPKRTVLEKCQKLLAEGKEIDEEIICELLFEEIQRIENRSDPPCSGWIIDGYPTTERGARCLEKAISGYEEIRWEFKQSRLFPHQEIEDPKKPHVKSFTNVIILNIKDENALSRAAEEKVDEASTILMAYNKEEPCLIKWYEQFENVTQINAERDLESIAEEIIDIISKNREEITSSDGKEGIPELNEDEQTTGPAQMNGQEPENIRSDEEISKDKCFGSLEIDSAKLFDSDWFSMENLYIVGCKDVFRTLRVQRKMLLDYIDRLKHQFMKFLLAPDDKQEHISKFQIEYNQIDQDLRTTDEVKQELHRRLDELRDTLWDVSDKRKEQAEQELKTYKADSWVSDYKKIIDREFIQLLQLESNRYVHTVFFLRDFYNELYGKNVLLDGVNIEDLYIDLISTGSDSKKKVTTGSSSKKLSSTMGSDVTTAPFTTVLERAKEATNKVKEIEEYYARQQKKKLEKKKGKTSGDLNVDQQISELDEAHKIEKELYERRLISISQVHAKMIEEIDTRSHSIFNKMDDWIGARFKSEMDAISNLRRIIQDHIEQEKFLTGDLILEQ